MSDTCTWALKEGNWTDRYETECGDALFFEDHGPTENNYRFCPFCGRSIVIKKEAKESQE